MILVLRYISLISNHISGFYDIDSALHIYTTSLYPLKHSYNASNPSDNPPLRPLFSTLSVQIPNFIDIASAYPAQKETLGLKSIPTTLSYHSVGLPMLDNNVIIELRTPVYEGEVIGSVWNMYLALCSLII